MKLSVFFLFLIFYILSCSNRQENTIFIASKTFTESVILGEIIHQLLLYEGFNVKYQKELGGTRILWNALVRGDIHIYPEYNGTLAYEILAQHQLKSTKDIDKVLMEYPILKTAYLGFSNSYALAMKKETAKLKNIRSISDIKKYPQLNFGFSNEFIDRKDGWKALKNTYHFEHQSVQGLDHNLAYRGLNMGSLDVIDVYETDAEIKYYNLKVLKDNKGFFPEYKALILYNKTLSKQFPRLVKVLDKLNNKISQNDMITMNHEAKIKKKNEKEIAINFLTNKLDYSPKEIKAVTMLDRLYKNTLDHLYLSLISLFFAILIAIPLGILASEYQSFGQVIISIAGIIQTIPSLALLVLMIPLFGTGSFSAIVAMFLYSLLPIIRNTYTGINNIPYNIRESCLALGLSYRYKLFKIDLPLASRTILAGIKTSAVINVGTATLGALIGAGGYGQPILTGIRLDDYSLIMEGAIPAAILALFTQYFFDFIEKFYIARKWGNS